MARAFAPDGSELMTTMQAMRIIDECAGDILRSDGFKLEKRFVQHGKISVFKHSLFVAVTCLKIADKLRLRVDTRSLVRGALLHDYFCTIGTTATRLIGCTVFATPVGLSKTPNAISGSTPSKKYDSLAHVPVKSHPAEVPRKRDSVRRRQALRNSRNAVRNETPSPHSPQRARAGRQSDLAGRQRFRLSDCGFNRRITGFREKTALLCRD